MQKSALAGAPSVLLALALSGCATADRVTGYLAAPATAKAAANLKTGAQAVVCAVSTGARLAGQIEAAVAAGQAAIGTTGKVTTVSALVCTDLGGVVTGQ